jgi:site-specific DNA recombinase
MKRAVGYIRVSTEEQTREGVSLDMQAHKIRGYADLHDMELTEILADEGLSGKSIKVRPGIQKVLEAIRKKEVQAVIVYKLDRLARNTIETLQMAEAMKKARVGLHSICEKLDTESAIGEFFFTLLASLAQMERKQIGERTKAALDRKKQKGERVSRKAPFGYRFDNARVVQDDQEQGIIRKMQTLSESGLSIRKISKTLASDNIFNRAGKPFGIGEIHKIVREFN